MKSTHMHMRDSLEPLRSYYASGVMALIDKPLEWTSFDVVNKIRYRLRYDLGMKKIKVGHAGTLDPLASGLLIICIGKETKNIDQYQAMTKEYTGEITLGATTPSYDAETEIDRRFPVDHITSAKIAGATNDLLGEQDQTVPVFSAVKIDGVRSYKLARECKSVRTKSRKVQIDSFEITDVQLPKVRFRVSCSKGTYIRSLAYDFGQLLDSGGYLSSLRRTKIGDYSVSDALSIDQWVAQLQKNIRDL